MRTKSWSEGAVRLRWRRAKAGYVVNPDGLRLTQQATRGTVFEDMTPVPTLQPIDGTVEEYEVAVGEQERAIVIDLLNMPETEEGVLSFASNWGPLYSGSPSVKDYIELRKKLDRIYKLKVKRQALLEELRNSRISQLTAEVGTRAGTRKPELLWFAKNLAEFCWLEVLADIGFGTAVRECGHCKGYFTSSKKSRVADYCGGNCRQAAYRRRIAQRKVAGRR